MEYLDETGLAVLWNKIKGLVSFPNDDELVTYCGAEVEYPGDDDLADYITS
jgi:hypothetical protein